MRTRTSPGDQPTTGGTLPLEPDATAQALHALIVAVVRRISRDLSLTALATLSTLQRSGPRRVTHLAAVEGITQPSMTALITNLERAGYVERHHDLSDGRVTLIALTPTGLELLQDRRSAGQGEIAQLIARLPADQAAALSAAIPAIDHLRQLDTAQRDPGRED